MGILHEHYAVDRNLWTFEKVAVTVPEPLDNVRGPATGEEAAPKPR